MTRVAIDDRRLLNGSPLIRCIVENFVSLLEGRITDCSPSGSPCDHNSRQPAREGWQSLPRQQQAATKDATPGRRNRHLGVFNLTFAGLAPQLATGLVEETKAMGAPR